MYVRVWWVRSPWCQGLYARGPVPVVSGCVCPHHGTPCEDSLLLLRVDKPDVMLGLVVGRGTHAAGVRHDFGRRRTGTARATPCREGRVVASTEAFTPRLEQPPRLPHGPHGLRDAASAVTSPTRCYLTNYWNRPKMSEMAPTALVRPRHRNRRRELRV